ncbi:MAG: aminopeptidase [Bacteroidia bacterium]
MKIRFFVGLVWNALCMFCMVWLMLNSALSLYLLKMGRGQLNIILNTRKIQDVLKDEKLSKEEKDKLLLVEKIRQYSVDSLGYKPTKNFTTYFDQKNQPLLWVITACKPLKFEAYEWNFPMLGNVSYKGFFNKNIALHEYLKLAKEGYDTDLSTVSAWSTLGWLPDPILSSMLKRSKARLANLLFHELFHATYYAPGTVDVNENLANFIGNKATLLFLRNDTSELRNYLEGNEDDSTYNRFIFDGYQKLENFYKSARGTDTAELLKQKSSILMQIYYDASRLKINKPGRYKYVNQEILSTKNAFFINARRYDGLYDSLNRVLELKYKGNLKNMILALQK